MKGTIETENFYVVRGDKGRGLIKMWTKHVPSVELSAMAQLVNCSELPFVYRHIAVMPDVHCGYGATIGSVIPTRGAVVPSAVGVDIGCGMMAVRTELTAADLPADLKSIRSAIESVVPHGRTNNGQKGDKGAWNIDSTSKDFDIPVAVEDAWMNLLEDGYERLADKHQKLRHANTVGHLGTLGTGNHFIEVCLDEDYRVWIMLHSGSRGIGNKIGTYFSRVAKDLMKKYYIDLPDKDLAFLPEGTSEFDDYMEAVSWAQKFARINRELMMDAVIAVLEAEFPLIIGTLDPFINCHHNYVAKENHFGNNVWVTRKGAVRARKDDLGIIPGSMGTCSYIVKGKGNPESFNSCSHGAGRVMSRTEARKVISLEAHREATEGVECRKDEGVLDESPVAYKNIDSVMESQADLVEVLYKLHQIICVKG